MNNDLRKLELRGKQLVQNFIKIEKKLAKDAVSKDLKRLLETQIVVLDASVTSLLLLLQQVDDKR